MAVEERDHAAFILLGLRIDAAGMSAAAHFPDRLWLRNLTRAAWAAGPTRRHERRRLPTRILRRAPQSSELPR